MRLKAFLKKKKTSYFNLCGKKLKHKGAKYQTVFTNTVEYCPKQKIVYLLHW